MREHGGGAVVNITSISAVRASTLRSAYGTSKAGLAHLTKQLAVELASLGIRVNGVAPGPVETAMAKAVHTPEIRADYHDAIPLNRYGLEEELAEAVFFLCSDRASYITGQILAVDGGFDAAESDCRRCAAKEGIRNGSLILSNVVPASAPGPIRRSRAFERRCSTNFAQPHFPWLWVPARRPGRRTCFDLIFQTAKTVIASAAK